MKYKIRVWVHHEVVEELETDSLKKAREWWRKNWKKAEDFGNASCEWYVDGKRQNISQVIGLEEEECEN